MTRETKIGLVVAGSFLSVMGGLIVMKMRQSDAPAKETAKPEGPAPVQVAATTPNDPATSIMPARRHRTYRESNQHFRRRQRLPHRRCPHRVRLR